MASGTTLALDLIAFVVSILLFLRVNKWRMRKGLCLPPGPPRLPIVGNLFGMPRESSWLTYTEWGKVYGDIISVQVFGQAVVVLNSAKVARDLLEKKASIYSGRPTIPMFELMKWSWFEMSNTYSAKWRLQRKMLDRGLRPSAAVHYRSMEKDKVHRFLKQLLSRPKEFLKHIEHLQGAITMSLVYGYDVEEENDGYIKLALDTNEIGQRTMLPGSVIVNDLPFLKHLPEWLPGMGFKALARVGEKLGQEVVNRPFTLVKSNMQLGTARRCMTRENLLEAEGTHVSNPEEVDLAIAEASASVYNAGVDSTVSAISTLFLALILHPDVQATAHAELDTVTGGQRLPDYGDRSQLPYVEAVCKEVLRWRNVAPVGVPHATTDDDIYDGYIIPKGTTVISNIWAILHDPRVYPDPDKFKPERFLMPDGRVKEDATLTAVFGFGKRICPGRHLVESTLFIVAASLMATYTIGKAKDPQGNEIPVDGTYTGATILSFPKEFKCSVVARSNKAEELIRKDTWGNAAA
ncbi:cytochrome P450 [Artomyces pyxidatus]|uniref:Cytochrome P450 n=1 Tax=Artomyces pyxidatus TaxID=48021 RepID=A0ACB8SJZ9_9AGAM|nr:cytochrome P450 [Artomyces pyxidatus]